MRTLVSLGVIFVVGPPLIFMILSFVQQRPPKPVAFPSPLNLSALVEHWKLPDSCVVEADGLAKIEYLIGNNSCALLSFRIQSITCLTWTDWLLMVGGEEIEQDSAIERVRLGILSEPALLLQSEHIAGAARIKPSNIARETTAVFVTHDSSSGQLYLFLEGADEPEVEDFFLLEKGLLHTMRLSARSINTVTFED